MEKEFEKEIKEDLPLIKRHSDEISDILGEPPKWLNHYTNYILVIILILMIGGIFMFKYTDSISAPIKISKFNSVEWITSPIQGHIQINIENNQMVYSGDTIFTINNQPVINLKDSAIIQYGDKRILDYVNEGDTLMVKIVPNDEKISGILFIPVESKSSIKTGQKVIISLDEYPADTYGYIEGKVKNILFAPKYKNYFVEIDFPTELVTTAGILLNCELELTGEANIITGSASIRKHLFKF